jgi:hypothetical protein
MDISREREDSFYLAAAHIIPATRSFNDWGGLIPDV